jgi:hypothetical protein
MKQITISLPPGASLLVTNSGDDLEALKEENARLKAELDRLKDTDKLVPSPSPKSLPLLDLLENEGQSFTTDPDPPEGYSGPELRQLLGRRSRAFPSGNVAKARKKRQPFFDIHHPDYRYRRWYWYGPERERRYFRKPTHIVD